MWSGDALGKPVTVHGFYGEGEDEYSYTPGAGQTVGSFRSNAGTFSQVDAEQSFWGVFGRIDVSDSIYLAARYGVSNNDTAGVTGGDQVDRIQVGAGYWFNDSTLVKAEYVSQTEEAGSAGGACNQTAECDWDGFVVETSVSF